MLSVEPDLVPAAAGGCRGIHPCRTTAAVETAVWAVGAVGVDTTLSRPHKKCQLWQCERGEECHPSKVPVPLPGQP